MGYSTGRGASLVNKSREPCHPIASLIIIFVGPPRDDPFTPVQLVIAIRYVPSSRGCTAPLCPSEVHKSSELVHLIPPFVWVAAGERANVANNNLMDFLPLFVRIVSEIRGREGRYSWLPGRIIKYYPSSHPHPLVKYSSCKNHSGIINYCVIKLKLQMFFLNTSTSSGEPYPVPDFVHSSFAG